MMKKEYDAIVIGGGIQGLSLAYHLAQRGLTDVIVLEMNTLGSGSSGRPNGWWISCWLKASMPRVLSTAVATGCPGSS